MTTRQRNVCTRRCTDGARSTKFRRPFLQRVGWVRVVSLSCLYDVPVSDADSRQTCRDALALRRRPRGRAMTLCGRSIASTRIAVDRSQRTRSIGPLSNVCCRSLVVAAKRSCSKKSDAGDDRRTVRIRRETDNVVDMSTAGSKPVA